MKILFANHHTNSLPALEASLEPYRARLEGSYSGNGNCFEWPMLEGEGWN